MAGGRKSKYQTHVEPKALDVMIQGGIAPEVRRGDVLFF